MTEMVVTNVLLKLADPIVEELVFLYKVGDEVEWLKDELQWMKCFLIDAEAKRMRGNELIKNWLREVREVAHEAEDIIETFTLKIELEKKKGGLLGCVCASLHKVGCVSRHKVGSKIIALKAKIDHIKESRERCGLVNLAEATPSAAAADETLHALRRIHPHTNDSNTLVVGLDVHTEEIVGRLLNPSIKSRCVVSIVGIGGLGKTTLANKVFNDSKIRDRFRGFNALACISVSQDYKVEEIYKQLVNQIMGKTMAELKKVTELELSTMLREYLIKWKLKYLVVLDDIWEEYVWDRLIREALPEMNNKSRVMITTRNMNLATSIDRTIPPYELPFLNEDESWALFLNKVFLPDESCSEELERIGHPLVKKCGGLPLALEVLGGILYSKERNSVTWTSVADHFDWGSTDKGGDCSKILGLSYDNLPHHHLKSCFVYLGVFPEDSVIKAQQLIELWIAEGFIPHSETHLMEDTAHAYLEEMAYRSMIQIVEKDWLGSSASVSSLRIHDLFRDLCMREAREEDLFNIHNMTSNSSSTLQDTINIHGKNLQRLVVHGDISTTADFVPPRNLKSILQFGKTGDAPAIIIPNGLKLLRVIHFVDTENANDEKFFKMITKMRHLRYLRLSDNSSIGFFPPSIRNLCKLQTLDLFGGVGVRDIPVLPDWLGEIRTLRHLYLFRLDYIGAFCSADIGSLTNLQTLDVLLNASEGRWMERGLEKLVNIRILKVRNLAGEEQMRVFIYSLRKMKYLSYLKVEGVIPIEILSGLSENTHLRKMNLWGAMSVRQLPESHEFPPNLTKLTLMGFGLSRDPMPTLEKLPYLRVLKLYRDSYIEKEMVCTSGCFPRLHELYLTGLKELEEWRMEDGAMSNLTFLSIDDCRKLRTLPEGLQYLRSMKKLKLFGYSAKDGVRREVGEDWYKIQHVPHITLDGHLV